MEIKRFSNENEKWKFLPSHLPQFLSIEIKGDTVPVQSSDVGKS